MNKHYDDSDLNDIIRHSYQLLNRSFLEVLESASQNNGESLVLLSDLVLQVIKGLGTLLEEFFYGFLWLCTQQQARC